MESNSFAFVLSRSHAFILVAMDYFFTKIEAEPLRKVTKKRAPQSHPITVHVDDLVY